MEPLKTGGQLREYDTYRLCGEAWGTMIEGFEMVDGGKFEVALVGDFQCGKSTFFNMLCGGRDISPRGNGVKTSSCAVSVCAICGGAEYAVLEWYSEAELIKKLRDIKEDCESRGESIEYDRAERIITTFRSELPTLLYCRKVGVETARSCLSYPLDWEQRWEVHKNDGGYHSIKDLAFFFLKRVVFHLDVELPLEGMFTDTPGFNAGAWDSLTAKEAMRRANVIVCIMNGREKVVTDTYFRAFDWLKREGLASKLYFSVNAKSLSRGELFAKTNRAEIMRRGFVIDQGDIPVFSALLAYMTASSMCSKGDVGRAIADWLDLDILDDKDKISVLASSRQQIEKAIQLTQMLSSLRSFAERIRNRPPVVGCVEEGLVNSSRGLVPDAGYVWLNPSDPQDMRVKWVPGSRMPNHPHVLAGAKAKNWIPEAGYDWVSDSPGDLRVCWKPGKPYSSDSVYIVADKTEGTWRPVDGFDWIDATNMGTKLGKGVRWCPGRDHPFLSGVIATTTVGSWKPKEGYRWADDTSPTSMMRYGCVWSPGMPHSEIANIRASKDVGDWEPAPGYMWSDWFEWLVNSITPTLNQKLKSGVKWAPGTAHPDYPHVEAASERDRWVPEDGWRFVNADSNDFRVREGDIIEKAGDGIRSIFSELFS